MALENQTQEKKYVPFSELGKAEATPPIKEGEKNESGEKKEEIESKKIEQKKEEKPKKEEKEEVRPEVIEAGGNESSDSNDTTDEEGGTDEAEEFWTEVDRELGEEVQIEFGDIPKSSPKAVALKAKAYAEHTLDKFEEDIATKYPSVYRALELAINGLNPADAFKDSEDVDYSNIQLTQDNEAQQEIIYRDYLKARGLKPDEIDDAVEAAKGKARLFDKSKEALTELNLAKSERDKVRESEIKNKIEAKQKIVNETAQSVKSIIDKGNLNGLNIPAADKNKLFDSFLNNLTINEGEVIYFRKLSKDDIATALQVEYFRMKNGNLSEVVKRQAQTENTKKFKLKVEKNNKNAGEAPNIGQSKYVPLSQL